MEDINKKLISLGYTSHVRVIKNEKYIYSYIENKLNTIFFINKKGSKLILSYTIGQLPIEKQFKNSDDLIVFTTEIFQLEEK